MRKEVKKSLNGKDYVFYQFGASDGLKLWLRITKIIAQPIGVLASSASNGLKTDLKDLSIDKAVEALFNNFDVDDVLDIIKTLCSQVMFEGKRVNEIFDVHFAGDYAQILDVVKEALEVNYKDFLLKIGEKIGIKKLPAKAK